MDRLAELLSALPDFASLSDVDLSNLRADLQHAIQQAADGEKTREVVELMKGAKDSVLAIKTELAERQAEAAAIEAEAEAVLAELEDPAPEGDDAETPGTSADGEPEVPGPETPPDAPVAETPAEAPAAEATPVPAAPVPVAAAQGESPKPARRPPVKVPARHQPRVTTRGPALVAAAGIPHIAVGQQFGDLEAVHRAMLETWVSLRASGDGRPNTIATIDYRDMFPEERHLANGDPNEVLEKVFRYLDERKEEKKALVASGGLGGAIATPLYREITYGQSSRPVRDALPSFLATRGAITYNPSPTLADIVLDTSLGAIGTVTVAQDLAGATKNVQEISAPTAVTVTVEAETLRFQQGNFSDKFYPERMAAFQRLGMVAFARHNEALRLADIKTGSTVYTDTPAKFGAFRDLKREFLGAVAELRDRIRDNEQQMRVLMPDYVPGMLVTDLTAQQPGDDAWDINVARMRQSMQSWDPYTTITFTYDSIRGRQLTTPTTSGRTGGFDADVEWCIFPEGTWLFLDAGSLDLGIVRDSTLNATNKFQTFYESWEAVARIAPLSEWITSSLCASGGSQAAQNIAVCSPQGS